MYPTRDVCQNIIFLSRFEVSFNRAIALPNCLYILLGNRECMMYILLYSYMYILLGILLYIANTMPNTAFRNSKNLRFHATLKYAKIAPEIVSSSTS